MKNSIKNFQDLAISTDHQKAIKGGDGDISGSQTTDYIGITDLIDG